MQVVNLVDAIGLMRAVKKHNASRYSEFFYAKKQ